MRHLAREQNTSVDTVRRALALLVRRGVVAADSNGEFVTGRSTRSDGSGHGPIQVAIVGGLTAVGSNAPNVGYLWSSEIISAILTDLSHRGYQMVSVPVPDHARNPAKALLRQIDDLRDHLRGLILFDQPVYLSLVPELDARNLRWITINRLSSSIPYNFVRSDHFEAGNRAGWCLAKLGHASIAVLTVDVPDLLDESSAVGGIVAGFMHGGGALHRVTTMPCSVQTAEKDAYGLVCQLMRRRTKPTAIIGLGDRLAWGALRACRDLGLAIPKNVAVIGMTGVQHSATCDPPLTVFGQDIQRIGAEAVGMIDRLIEGQTHRIPGTVVAPRMIERGSLVLTAELRQEMAQRAAADALE